MRQIAIAFRTDVGAGIGLGHLRRCLSLAEELRRQDATIHFVLSLNPVAQELLLTHRFNEFGLLQDSDTDLTQTLRQVKRCDAQVLVVDSYAVDMERLAGLRTPSVVVIDDLADQLLPVHVVINGAANAHELAYRTSPHTRLLLGPAYVLLHEEFSQEPNRMTRAQVERVLITVGGMDPLALTPRLVHWTQVVLPEVAVDVVVGPFFSPGIVLQLEQLAQRNPLITIHKDPPKIRDLMLACDLAITGGGQTTYELAATGTPAVAIRLADNQNGNLRGLAAKGSLVWIGDGRDDNLKEQVVQAVQGLASDKDRRNEMSRAGRTQVDGLGAKRVAQTIFEACGT